MTAPGQWVRVSAPAKVNLHLDVLGARPDGFHEIDTVFQAVGLADGLAVGLAPARIELTVQGADVGPNEENLAYRAAESFVAATGLDAGVEVRLVKRIPPGAGLGGGSSDAAAALRALNRLAGHPLDRARLVALAAALGSDVPFFLGTSARAAAGGRGERLEALPPLPPAWIVLVLPPVHVETGRAYRAVDAARAAGAVPEGSSRGPGRTTGVGLGRLATAWEEVARSARNDFQAVVAADRPEVARALELLAGAGAASPLLSGSGAACFGIFRSARDARRAARRIEEASGWRVVVARTLRRLPPVRPCSRPGR